MKLIRVLTLAAVGANLAACATITRGRHEAWEVQTTPPGAKVTTSLGDSCASTPCSIKMRREAEFTAKITKPGYEPVDVSVTHVTAGGGAAGMAGNVVLGGVIGAVIDANTGATQKLTPNPVVVVLQPLADKGAK